MKRLLEPSTTLYPVPVVLVTCGDDRPNVFTLNRISSCNAERRCWRFLCDNTKRRLHTGGGVDADPLGYFLFTSAATRPATSRTGSSTTCQHDQDSEPHEQTTAEHHGSHLLRFSNLTLSYRIRMKAV